MSTHVYRSPLVVLFTVLALAFSSMVSVAQAFDSTDQVALTVQQGVRIELLGSTSAVQWHWLSNQGQVGQSGSAKALQFESSQRGSGFSVSFDAASYRASWFVIRAEFQSDHGGWVGPRYFVQRADGKKFFDPAVTHPGCEPIPQSWTKCTIYGYVPDGAKTIVVDIVGFNASYKIRSFSIRKADANYSESTGSESRLKLDNALSLMKQKFIRTDQVAWKEMAAQANSWARSPSPLGWISGIAWVASELPSDGHTYVKANPMIKGSGSGASNAHEYAKNVVTSLDSKTGYVRLVASPESAADRQSYGDETKQQVSELLQHGATSWVVDLRGNSGGSLYAMLNAISPLIGPRRLGYFEYANGSRAAFGISINGSYISKVDEFDDISIAAPITPALKFSAPHTTLYVLIDHNCASACESIAIALKELPAVKVFGEPTAGLATGNGTYPLGRFQTGAHRMLYSRHSRDKSLSQGTTHVVTRR